MAIQQFMRFLVVGTLGFLTEALILTAMTHTILPSPFFARIPSFCIAVIVTWVLNSHFTFQNHNKSAKQTFPRYISGNIVGLGINILTYTLAISLIPLCHEYPVLALACGSIAGLFFNFTASKFLIFKAENNT